MLTAEGRGLKGGRNPPGLSLPVHVYVREEGVPGREAFGSMPQTTLSASEVSSKIERNVDENALSCVDCRTPPRRASLHPRHHERVPEGFRPAFTAPRPCCCYSGWVFDIVLPREPCDSNSKCSLCPKRGRSCKDYSCTLLRVLSSQPIVTPRMFTPKTWLQLCWAGFMFCLVSQEGNPHSQDLCLSMLFLFFSKPSSTP